MSDLEQRLGYRFDDRTLLEVSLTHRSYTAEHVGAEHNERMEFLGDAVLELVMTELLYERFGEMREGEMAKLRASLVSGDTLSTIATSLDIGTALRLGRGEEASLGREKDSILADAMEAVIAAVYLDGGLDAVRPVIHHQWESRVWARSVSPGSRDYKTRLQEVLARAHLEPAYQVRGEGPDHDRIFTATVSIDGAVRGEGTGRSKKEAQQEAARVALEHVAAPADDTIAIRAIVRGRVQGVGFRYFALDKARNVAGWVRNRPSGEVELHVQGAPADVNALLDSIRTGPRSAVVAQVDQQVIPIDPDLQGFTVR
ncbi:MAG: ribonuclease III [Acidimicrobiia bacterium]